MNSLLEFSQVFISDTREKKIYVIRDRNSKQMIGRIQWVDNQYAFVPDYRTTWNKVKLNEIIGVLGNLNTGENNG